MQFHHSFQSKVIGEHRGFLSVKIFISEQVMGTELHIHGDLLPFITELHPLSKNIQAYRKQPSQRGSSLSGGKIL